MMNAERRRLLTFAGCLLAAFLFCLKFSLSTSFLYKGIHGFDSAIFYIIGKYWAQGVLPYVDLWDHKGPMIFFINCIGHLITGGKTGVFIIQVVSLSVFIYFTHLTFRRRFSFGISSSLTIVCLFWLACSYEAGNLTEEYLLPYLAMAFYFTARWLDEAEKKVTDHNPWQAYLLGIILGFCFLTRLTNALGACGIMLAVCIILILRKQWGNLFKNILFYFLGLATITIPFIAYFGIHGALGEMFFGSFGYNVANLSVTAERSFSNTYGLANLAKFGIMSVSSIGLVLLSLFFLFKDKSKRVHSFVWLISSALISTWLLTSNLSAHYRTLIVPYFAILILGLFDLKNLFPRFASIIIVIAIAGPVVFVGRKWSGLHDYYHDTKVDILSSLVKQNIPITGHSRFVGYQIEPGVYLETDIKPCYRNFNCQETQADRSEYAKNDILDEFHSLQADYLLVYSEDVLIKEILEEFYDHLVSPEELPRYHLWVRKDLSDERN